jgi:hypothetical protein
MIENFTSVEEELAGEPGESQAETPNKKQINAMACIRAVKQFIELFEIFRK